MKTIETLSKTQLLLFPMLLFSLLTGCGQGPEAPTGTDPEVSQPPTPDQDLRRDDPDNIVAMVDDRPIPREDAEKRAKMNMRKDGIDESDPDFESKLRIARKGAVDMLIESYILQEAATDTIELTSKEVEEELLSVKSRHPSRESYEEGLRRAGFTEEEFRRVLAKELRIRKVMGVAAAKGVPTPTPDDAREFYEQNPFLFEWPHRVRYDEIAWLLRPEVSEASAEEAMREMNHLAERMRATPELFNTILREATSSDWGPRGVQNPYTSMERLPQEVQEALQVLNIDEPSQPVRTPLGISILCLRSTRQTYDSAYQEILQSLYEARAMDNLEQWKERQKSFHTIRILDLDYYEGKAESNSDSTGRSEG